MTRDEAAAILDMPRHQAIEAILKLAEKAEKWDCSHGKPGPETPSGMIAVYTKSNSDKRRKKPGRPNGHSGSSRSRPCDIDETVSHELCQCPDCGTSVAKSLRRYRRVIEDIPPVTPQVTEHLINGYWCPKCQKIVTPVVTDALPNARISPGGLTQDWHTLAEYLWDHYHEIGSIAKNSAVLHADETGWRLNGITHWLWCFTNKTICYYVITRSRGSPVIKQVLGLVFKGILVCDFWGAYNKIGTLATQRCFFHLFTELVKVDRNNRSVSWKSFRKKLSRMLRDAVRLSEHLGMEADKRDRLKIRLKNRLNEMIENTYEDRDVKRLVKRLRRHQEEIFTFLEHPNVSPYNNHAEQQMRKAVLCRKISQQNRSESGAVTQAILMTLFRTAELQHQNPVESVLSAAKEAILNGKSNTPKFKLAA